MFPVWLVVLRQMKPETGPEYGDPDKPGCKEVKKKVKVQLLGSVWASEADLGSSEPGAAGIEKKNKTKVRQKKITRKAD